MRRVRCVSVRATPTVIDAVFPATSVDCTRITFAPAASVTLHKNAEPLLIAGKPLHVIPARPDNESVAVPRTIVIRSAVAVPSARASMVIVGAVLSMLTLTAADALFPPLSTAVPDASHPAPSCDSVTGGVQLAMPDSSAQVNVTVTA